MDKTTAIDPFYIEVPSAPEVYWYFPILAAPESFPAHPPCPYKSPENVLAASPGFCCCQLRSLQADPTTTPTIRARSLT